MMAQAKKKTTPKTASEKKITKKSAPLKAKAASSKKQTLRKSGEKKTPATAPKITLRKAAVKKVTVKKAAQKPKPKAKAKANVKNVSHNNAPKQATTFKMENIMTQGPMKFDKLAQEASNASREGMDAFVKSGTIFAKGFEDIMRMTASLMQSSAEKQSQYFKSALSSKTLNEWAEVQNKIAQESFDDFMEGATKLSELSTKLLNDASEPLNKQTEKAIKKATSAAA